MITFVLYYILEARHSFVDFRNACNDHPSFNVQNILILAMRTYGILTRLYDEDHDRDASKLMSGELVESAVEC